MKDRGVLIGRVGRAGQVLKLRPPLADHGRAGGHHRRAAGRCAGRPAGMSDAGLATRAAAARRPGGRRGPSRGWWRRAKTRCSRPGWTTAATSRCACTGRGIRRRRRSGRNWPGAPTSATAAFRPCSRCRRGTGHCWSRRKAGWPVPCRGAGGEPVAAAPGGPHVMARIGRLTAALHETADAFVPPPGFSRPRRDARRSAGGGAAVGPVLGGAGT